MSVNFNECGCCAGMPTLHAHVPKRVQPYEKVVKPKDVAQTVMPDEGYGALSYVIVEPIPNDKYARIKWDGVALTVY